VSKTSPGRVTGETVFLSGEYAHITRPDGAVPVRLTPNGQALPSFRK